MAELAPALDAVQARFPDDPEVRCLVAHVLFDGGDARRAAAEYARVPTETMEINWVPLRAVALAAAGNTAEALQLVEAALSRAPGHAGLLLARAQLSGSRRQSRPPAKECDAATIVRPAGAPRARPRANGSRHRACRAIMSSPESARTMVGTGAHGTLRSLHPGLATLFVAEMERIGDWSSAERVRRTAVDARVSRAAILAFVLDGVRDPELGRLDHESLAALEVVRSRVLLESGDDQGSQALLDAAKKRDPWSPSPSPAPRRQATARAVAWVTVVFARRTRALSLCTFGRPPRSGETPERHNWTPATTTRRR